MSADEPRADPSSQRLTPDPPPTSESAEEPPPTSEPPKGTRLYQGSVRALSFAFLALGLAILASTLANGGGPLSVGVLMGVVFIAVGAARLWLSVRTSR